LHCKVELFCFKMNHYTYILYSNALNRYYVGFTSGTLQERLHKQIQTTKAIQGKQMIGLWCI
ncbi:hypothetical protein ACKGJY_01445, partial [Hyunsoonleella sp. 2307UL5-6]